MLTSTRRLALLTCSLFCLTACAPVLALMGSSGSAIQLAAQLDRAKLVADGVSYMSSRKSLTDHAISKATGADCKIMNVVAGAPVCASASHDTPVAALATDAGQQ